jgi:hypothetical protein
MKGFILPWSSGTLSLFEQCIPSFTVVQCTLRTHESLTVRVPIRLPVDAPTWRHAGVTGPAGRDRSQRTRFGGAGKKQPGTQSCGNEILLKLTMTIWNATIYCVLVVRGTVMVSLR